MNIKKTRGRQPLEIDNYLKELSIESKLYLQYKNSSSASIKRLENSLAKMNNDVSFCFFIVQEIIDNKIFKWYIEWESNKKSKSYGLNLLCEEINENNKIINIIREVFLTCEINLRYKFSEYLIPFINAYKDHLRELCNGK